MLNLLTYISILSLGLIGLYRLRSGLLIIQRRRDAAQRFSKSSGISQAHVQEQRYPPILYQKRTNIASILSARAELFHQLLDIFPNLLYYIAVGTQIVPSYGG